MFSYVPEPYPGEVVVYEANVAPLLYLPQIGRTWHKIAPRAEIVSIVGTHIGIMHEPYVSALADDMRERVSKFFASNLQAADLMPREPRFDILFEPVKIGPVVGEEPLLSGAALQRHGTCASRAPTRRCAASKRKADGRW